MRWPLFATQGLILRHRERGIAVFIKRAQHRDAHWFSLTVSLCFNTSEHRAAESRRIDGGGCGSAAHERLVLVVSCALLAE